MAKKTLYEFLSIEPEASSEEIKVAALYFAQKFNPKIYPGNPRVIQRFKTIQRVYKILGNSEKRAAYDAKLAVKQWDPIVYRVETHWFASFEILLFMAIVIYFLATPSMLFVLLRKIDFLPEIYILPVLYSVLVLNFLILLYTLLRQVTTSLIISAKQTVVEFGFFSKKKIEIPHTQFEEIKIKQSILSKLFDFGTIKIKGRNKNNVGVIKIKVNNVAMPYIFKKRLMRLIKHNAYHRI